VLRLQLAANGVRIAGVTRRGAVPDTASELLAYREGRDLAETIRLMLKYSNNMIAECLVKAMGSTASGRRGTWKNGIAALRRHLRALGLDLRGAVVLDGSGLAPGNRLSPRMLVSALRLARSSFAFGPEFLSALPIAARDGTLKNRGAEVAGAVRAKTGLLDGVSALSGYARRTDRAELVFSVLVNGYRGSDGEAMKALDRFLKVVVRAPLP